MDPTNSSIEQYCRNERSVAPINNTYVRHGIPDPIGWQKLLLALAALIATLIYMASVVGAMRAKVVGRKLYVLLLNRCAGDVLFLLFFIVAFGVGYSGYGEHTMNGAFGNISMAMGSTFWSTMVSYTLLSAIKLYAIACPIEYRKRVTLKRITRAIAISWLILAVTVAVKWLATIFITKRSPITQMMGCTKSQCHWYICKWIGMIYFFIYVVTLLCFAATMLFIYRSGMYTRKFSNHHCQKGVGVPLAKLTVNIVALAVLHFPLALLCAFYAFSIKKFWCNTYMYFPFKELNFIDVLKSVVAYPMLLRILLDALIGFVMEREVRRLVTELLGLSTSSITLSAHT